VYHNLIKEKACVASVTEKYSMLAPTAFGANEKVKLEKALFDYFLTPLPNQSKILEIGPGAGSFARESIARGHDYLGVEPSRILRDKLESEGIRVVDQTVPPIEMEDSSLDLVHSFHIVEHMIDYQQVMEFFMESHRVLKPGGYISVVAPNYRMVKQLFFQYEYQHSFITTLDNLRNALSDCGFEVIDSKCFLMWLAPRLRWIDRLVAHICIPIGTNILFESLVRVLFSERFLFRLHKNLFDNVALLARKPLATP
jgi:SAM-dependent methyltransferase